MKIIRSRKYQSSLLVILQYIARDKVSASRSFQKELDRQIRDIPRFPYRHRASIYFEDDNVRDLVYKKYTVNYEINPEANSIEILDIFNQNKPSKVQ